MEALKQHSFHYRANELSNSNAVHEQKGGVSQIP
jgi:hypothetical protein